MYRWENKGSQRFENLDPSHSCQWQNQDFNWAYQRCFPLCARSSLFHLLKDITPAISPFLHHCFSVSVEPNMLLFIFITLSHLLTLQPPPASTTALVKSVMTFTLLKSNLRPSPFWHLSTIWHSPWNAVLHWPQASWLSWFPLSLSGCAFSDRTDSSSSPHTHLFTLGCCRPPSLLLYFPVSTQAFGDLI